MGARLGKQLFALHAPSLRAPVAPTPHPLANVLGGIAALTGTGADTVLLAVSFLSFASLGYAAFAAGRRSFGTIAGIVAAAILLTRPLLIAETLQASLDIPFLALVLGALAVELGPRRRPAVVIGMLAVAGLLRPEAWLLAAYLAWIWRTLPRRAVRALVVAAASAPVIWLLADWVLAGDPLYSLTRTQALAAHFDRPLGVGSAVSSVPSSLASLIGTPVL